MSVRFDNYNKTIKFACFCTIYEIKLQDYMSVPYCHLPPLYRRAKRLIDVWVHYK